MGEKLGFRTEKPQITGFSANSNLLPFREVTGTQGAGFFRFMEPHVGQALCQTLVIGA